MTIFKCSCGYENQVGTLPQKCPKCGTLVIKEHSLQKLRVIDRYYWRCVSKLCLSKWRKWNKLVLIDVCAGSGKVNLNGRDEIKKGSPVILAELCQRFKYKFKHKDIPPIECVFIEKNPKIFKSLEKNIENYPFCETINEDSNLILDDLLSKYSKDFILLFVDPFGINEVDIKNIADKLKPHKHNEMLIHFSWQAFLRICGLNPTNPSNEKAINTACKIVPGLKEKLRDNSFNNLSTDERAKEIMDLFVTSFERSYPYIKYIPFPLNKTPIYYYFIFTTRHSKGHHLMEEVIQEVMKEESKAVYTLDEFMENDVINHDSFS